MNSKSTISLQLDEQSCAKSPSEQMQSSAMLIIPNLSMFGVCIVESLRLMNEIFARMIFKRKEFFCSMNWNKWLFAQWVRCACCNRWDCKIDAVKSRNIQSVSCQRFSSPKRLRRKLSVRRSLFAWQRQLPPRHIKKFERLEHNSFQYISPPSHISSARSTLLYHKHDFSIFCSVCSLLSIRSAFPSFWKQALWNGRKKIPALNLSCVTPKAVSVRVFTRKRKSFACRKIYSITMLTNFKSSASLRGWNAEIMLKSLWTIRSTSTQNEAKKLHDRNLILKINTHHTRNLPKRILLDDFFQGFHM